MKTWFLNLPITKKQIFVLTLVGLVPMILVTFIAVQLAKAALEEKAFDQLDAVRDIKGAAISRYFERVENQIMTMARMPSIVAAMDSFSRSFPRMLDSERLREEDVVRMKEELRSYYVDQYGKKYQESNEGKQADIPSLLDTLDDQAIVSQYYYIQTNVNPIGEKHLLDAANGKSVYHRSHALYHPGVRNFLEKFGYYDIFLVDIESGDIVYSVFKELDYGTSLRDGPYANTNFAEAFKDAAHLNEGEFALKDYQPYTPSYEAPASFIATPVFNQGERIGVLIFQMPLEPINDVMAERSGMGKTGETYLVGSDLLMRSDSYLDPKNHTVDASFRHPELGRVDTEAARSALQGKKDNNIIIDYNGNPVLSSYAPLNIGDFKWAIMAEIDEAEAFAPVSRLVRNIFIIGIAFVVVIVLFAMFVSKLMTAPIMQLRTSIKRVQQGGNFKVSIDNKFSDEVGETARAFNDLMSNLNQAIDRTNDVLSELGQGRFDARVDSHFPGQLGELASGVDTAVGQVAEATAEAQKQNEKAREQSEIAKIAAEEAKAQARETLVIKQALDVSATSVMIANPEFNVVYQNTAAEELMREVESDLQKSLPHFEASKLIGSSIDVFHKNPSHQRKLLSGLTETYKTNIEVSGLHFQLSATPIRDESGAYLGAVVEWQNLTTEINIEREIDRVIDSATAGDFSVQLDMAGKSGFFEVVSQGLNRLLGTTNTAIHDVKRVFGALAEGDLSQTIDREYEGQLGQLKEDANNTVHKLREVIGDISQASSTIAGGAAEISQGMQHLGKRTEQQAASLEETAASMEQMTTAVQQSEGNARDATALANNSVEIARAGDDSIEKTAASMEEISESSKKISNIIGVIDEIAFQTNLLALNAAVEAARAGEQGRGFAVVAQEVRNLAQRSASAAKEIKELIVDSVEKVDAGTSLVNQSDSTLKEIVNEIEQVSKKMEDILNAASEQSSGIGQVNQAVTHMDDMTQENSSMVEEAMSASENMANQAHRLDRLVAFFKS
ncbi:MAG: HAMP domain-containing protein [Agarilytica sp.]